MNRKKTIQFDWSADKLEFIKKLKKKNKIIASPVILETQAWLDLFLFQLAEIQNH